MQSVSNSANIASPSRPKSRNAIRHTSPWPSRSSRSRLLSSRLPSCRTTRIGTTSRPRSNSRRRRPRLRSSTRRSTPLQQTIAPQSNRSTAKRNYSLARTASSRRSWLRRSSTKSFSRVRLRATTLRCRHYVLSSKPRKSTLLESKRARATSSSSRRSFNSAASTVSRCRRKSKRRTRR